MSRIGQLVRQAPAAAASRWKALTWGEARRVVVAALTIAAIAVPQSLATAAIAGVPPVAGLYASTLPVLGYALVGGSRVLVLGPEASSAALVAATVAPLAAGDPARHAALATLLALMVGVVCLAGGIGRLGFFADFIPRPALHGYTLGVAITLVIGQMGKLLGLTTSARDPFHQVVEVATRLGETHLPSAAVGAGVTIAILIMRRLSRRVPAALLLVLAAIAVTVAFDPTRAGIKVVGDIPGGLPRLGLPAVSLSDLASLFGGALAVAAVLFPDTILAGRSFGAGAGDEVRADRELAGLGAANLLAGVVQGFPVNASSARSSTNADSGARSKAVAPLSAVVVAAVLFFTDPLERLPLPLLAGIVMAAAIALPKLHPFSRLLRTRPVELVTALLTTAGVITLGLLQGLLIAVGFALLLLLKRAARPHDAVLGRTHDVDGFHDVERYADAETTPGLVVYRFDAPLFFANAEHFRRRVLALLDGVSPRARWLVLDAEAVTDVDMTALRMLRDLRVELAERGVRIVLARAKGPVRDFLERAGFVDELGRGCLFPSVRMAVRAFATVG